MCSPLVASSEQIRAGRHEFFNMLQAVQLLVGARLT
jgi:hypothetical protein